MAPASSQSSKRSVLSVALWVQCVSDPDRLAKRSCASTLQRPIGTRMVATKRLQRSGPRPPPSRGADGAVARLRDGDGPV